MERSITPIAVPKRGTHGTRVEPYLPVWRNLDDDELLEVFKTLKPYFALAQHRDTDLS